MLSNNIGLYGGAFDPVHKAHIIIAKKSLNFFNLNHLIFIPTGKSAFNKHLTDSDHRIDMLNKVIKDKKFLISNFEIEKSKNGMTSYTIDTIKSYFNPDNHLFFIMGFDAFKTFNQWKDWKIFLNYCHLIIINRYDDEFNFDELPSDLRNFLKNNEAKDKEELFQTKYKIFCLEIEKMAMESSIIKQKILNSEDLSDDLDQEVIKYIKEKNLYSIPGQSK
jgi:nicotinate-nucleotide adenylyltransferase